MPFIADLTQNSVIVDQARLLLLLLLLLLLPTCPPALLRAGGPARTWSTLASGAAADARRCLL